ncbi:MAG TPA: hypothetical protein VID27_07550 [Blastocatellia bacterium]|jgi:hypothetical protein
MSNQADKDAVFAICGDCLQARRLFLGQFIDSARLRETAEKCDPPFLETGSVVLGRRFGPRRA